MAERFDLYDAMYERWLRGGCDDSGDSDDGADASDDVAANNLDDDDELDAGTRTYGFNETSGILGHSRAYSGKLACGGRKLLPRGPLARPI